MTSDQIPGAKVAYGRNLYHFCQPQLAKPTKPILESHLLNIGAITWPGTDSCKEIEREIRMAKHELSTTLKNLKFMQRAAQREEKPKKEEEQQVIPDGNFPPCAPKRCVIIMEGNPHPGATKGRMSFQGFNPSIDKLSEEASKPRPEGSAACSSETSEIISRRENVTSQCGLENSNMDYLCQYTNEDSKRKNDDAYSEAEYPNKKQKNVLGTPVSSPSSCRSLRKQSKHEKLDWSVLKPPRPQKKKQQV